MHNIAIIGHRFIGDMLMCEPAIRWLASGVRLPLLIVCKSEQAQWITQKFYGGFKSICISNKEELKRCLRQSGVDVTIHFDRTIGTALTAWRAGVKWRFGERNECNQLFLSHHVAIAPKQHHSITHIDLMRYFLNTALDKQWIDEVPQLPSTIPRLKYPHPLRARYALVHIGTTRPAKTPPASLYQKIIDTLKHHQFPTVLAGDDASTSQQLFTKGCKNVVGVTDNDQWYELIAQAHLVISPDTATMHIAAALGIEVIALFGSTSGEETGGRGKNVHILQSKVPCSPCHQDRCRYKHSDARHMYCFADLPIQTAIQKVCARPGHHV